jgi:hypothetical protein
MNIPKGAEQEAERLLRLSHEQLLEELGRRVLDAEQPGGKARSQAFYADFHGEAVAKSKGTDFLREVGALWWRKLEAQLMKILCESDNADLKKLTGGKSIPALAAGLATAAVTSAIAAPPAWLIVAATLLAAKVAETGVAALCETWSSRHRGLVNPPPG